jgi:predicted AAA+ superfamily ATPase
LSYQSLARDLDLSPKTVQKYVDILVALHIVFLVAPYHRNIARALSKAPKLYFYDWAYVKGDAGAIFENLIATSLLKHTHFLADTTGQVQTLHFVQTTSGKEIDFVLANNEGNLEQAIEVKWADSKPAYALREILELHPNAKAIQLVYQLGTPYVPDPANPRLEVHPAAQWLNQLAA